MGKNSSEGYRISLKPDFALPFKGVNANIQLTNASMPMDNPSSEISTTTALTQSG